jgi:hypothetical protein
MSEKVDSEDARTRVKRKPARMRGRIDSDPQACRTRQTVIDQLRNAELVPVVETLDPVELVRKDRDRSISTSTPTRGQTIVRRLKGQSRVKMSTEEILALTRK